MAAELPARGRRRAAINWACVLVVDSGDAHSIRVRPSDGNEPGETVKATSIPERAAFDADTTWAHQVDAIRLELNHHLGCPSRAEAERLAAQLGIADAGIGLNAEHHCARVAPGRTGADHRTASLTAASAIRRNGSAPIPTPTVAKVATRPQVISAGRIAWARPPSGRSRMAGPKRRK